MEDALKLIISRSPAATREAMACLRAIRAGSPIVPIRYERAVDLALSDPEASFSGDERAELASHLTEDGGTRSTVFRFRLTKAERALLEDMAREAGVSASVYARRALFGDRSAA